MGKVVEERPGGAEFSAPSWRKRSWEEEFDGLSAGWRSGEAHVGRWCLCGGRIRVEKDRVTRLDSRITAVHETPSPSRSMVVAHARYSDLLRRRRARAYDALNRARPASGQALVRELTRATESSGRSARLRRLQPSDPGFEQLVRRSRASRLQRAFAQPIGRHLKLGGRCQQLLGRRDSRHPIRRPGMWRGTAEIVGEVRDLVLHRLAALLAASGGLCDLHLPDRLVDNRPRQPCRRYLRWERLWI